MTPLGTRKVLVVGATSGIGKAVASRLLGAGGAVVGVGRNSAGLADLLAVYPEALKVIAADVRRDGRLVERAHELLGGLDGVVYAAGVVRHEAPADLSEDAVVEQLGTNLVAPIWIGRDALQLLEPGGAIVSIASTLAEKPVATSAVYSATKAGLVALTKSWAVAGAARGVRANAVSPGVVDTPMVSRERQERLASQHLLGRVGTPDEVAHAVVHLLGAPWTTGTVFTVDGGLLAQE